MKRVLSIVLLMILTVGIFASIPAMADYVGEDFKGKVISSGAKVYAKASTSAKVLGTLKKGAVVTVTGAKGKWAYVRSGSKTAYMRIKDLCSDAPGGYVTVKKVSTVYYFRKNGKNKSGLAYVSPGKVLCVFGKDEKGRLLVGNRSQTTLGYISKKNVS